MEFKFNTFMSEKDYLEYNSFMLTRSPYGKKQIRNLRILYFVIILFGIAYYLFRTDFSLNTILGVVPLLLLGVLFQVLLKKILVWTSNIHIKSMKKSGKLPYEPESVLQFDDNGFCETTQYKRMECKYSMVEGISIVDNKIMYIHVNNTMSFILPLSCFESKEQYNDFLEFIKKKCTNIDYY